VEAARLYLWIWFFVVGFKLKQYHRGFPHIFLVGRPAVHCSTFNPPCAKNRNPHVHCSTFNPSAPRIATHMAWAPRRQMFIVRLDIWQAAISLHLIPCPHLIDNNPCANNRTGSFPSAHDVDSQRQLIPRPIHYALEAAVKHRPSGSVQINSSIIQIFFLAHSSPLPRFHSHVFNSHKPEFAQRPRPAGYH
jgi:hypothetical protein